MNLSPILANIEAEESILGGILLDPDALERVIDIISSSEAFYVKTHGEIYNAALKLHVQGKPTDLMSVTSWLQDHHLLDFIGGTATLAQLIDRTVSSVNIDRYAALVMDKYRRRQIITASNKNIELAQDTTRELDEVVGISEENLFAVTQTQSTENLKRISEDISETLQLIEDRYYGKKPLGINTGFYDLDLMTQGLKRSNLILLAGRPSMGKTAMALALSHAVAQQNEIVAIFSLEMSRQELLMRLISSITEVSIDKLARLNLEQSVLEEKMKEYYRKYLNIMELPMYINDSTNISVQQMRSQLRQLQIAERRKLGLVMIDYLQLIPGDENLNETLRIGRISRSLKGMARELDVPVLALSQLSRNVENRSDKRPVNSDLRDSGSLEQDGDLILMLYRDEYYNPNTQDKGIAEVIITKQRNGPVGTVKLLFKPEFTQFLNLQNPFNQNSYH